MSGFRLWRILPITLLLIGTAFAATTALQGPYKVPAFMEVPAQNTLDARKAHVEGQLAVLQSARQLLDAARIHLPKATAEEQEQTLAVLHALLGSGGDETSPLAPWFEPDAFDGLLDFDKLMQCATCKGLELQAQLEQAIGQLDKVMGQVEQQIPALGAVMIVGPSDIVAPSD